MISWSHWCVLVLSGLFAGGRLSAGPAAYDPLANPNPAAPAPATCDLIVRDGNRGRNLPVLIYLPDAKQPAPVVLFSPGLGASRQSYSYLGAPWAQHGYAVVFLQHPGSDSEVWQSAPAGERMAALARAANVENFLVRNKDVTAVLDQLQRWNTEEGHPLFGRLDLQRVGMAGHSFGAITTQAVSGECFPLGGSAYADARIKAALPMSPSGLPMGSNADAFGAVRLPWLLMTGTKDDSPIGDIKAAARREVYQSLPPGNKYELVLQNAEHSAFTDRPLPGDEEPRNPNHHRAVIALSIAFWDAYLREDAGARQWLDGDGPRTVLAADDVWEKK